MVEETFEPGMTVGLVARRHGVAPNQLFTWRRLVAQGGLTAAGSGEEVVPASDYRALQNQVRELHRLTNRCQETAVAQGFMPRSRKSFAVGFAAFVPHSALLSSNRMTAFVAAVRSTYLRMMLSTLPSVQPRISAITRSGNPAA
jgi:transposase-like protein